jgi:hypothetical protein
MAEPTKAFPSDYLTTALPLLNEARRELRTAISGRSSIEGTALRSLDEKLFTAERLISDAYNTAILFEQYMGRRVVRGKPL